MTYFKQLCSCCPQDPCESRRRWIGGISTQPSWAFSPDWGWRYLSHFWLQGSSDGRTHKTQRRMLIQCSHPLCNGGCHQIWSNVQCRSNALLVLSLKRHLQRTAYPACPSVWVLKDDVKPSTLETAWADELDSGWCKGHLVWRLVIFYVHIHPLTVLLIQYAAPVLHEQALRGKQTCVSETEIVGS